MNNEQLIKAALHRQNERASRLHMPDDMEQRVMGRINARRNRRTWWRHAALAASVAIILAVFFWPKPQPEAMHQQAIAVASANDSAQAAPVLSLKTDSPNVTNWQSERHKLAVRTSQTATKPVEKPAQSAATTTEDDCIPCEMHEMECEMTAMINEFENQ